MAAVPRMQIKLRFKCVLLFPIVPAEKPHACCHMTAATRSGNMIQVKQQHTIQSSTMLERNAVLSHLSPGEETLPPAQLLTHPRCRDSTSTLDFLLTPPLRFSRSLSESHCGL
ncbi:unnamed protein product [Pleuronectes platessa]|uniref:Uncharacterized protein n=1 Tax=Pleuronectes platessa TaxID=8262 RepID=A0A9N7TJD1_PLEPL|nr:unnamed protein product [Pleuronectes platessa]